jgi:hypothetical protein
MAVKGLAWCATLAVLVFASSVSVDAQRTADSFDELRFFLRTADTVVVADGSGHKMTGEVVDLSSTTLVLGVAGTRHTLTESQIVAISQRRRDSLSNGALIGFGLGAGYGLALALPHPEYGIWAVGFPLFYGVSGWASEQWSMHSLCALGRSIRDASTLRA